MSDITDQPKEIETKKKKQTTTQLPTGLVLPYLIFLRVINALTISTFFQADEYWQSLEPAHKFVFGYGYLTWEWETGLRSFIHPLVFTLPYYLSELLGLDEIGVIYLPKIFQGIIAGIGEFYLYKFTYKFTKNEIISRWVLGLSVISAWNWFVITRTFSNSFELTLTCVSLYYWIWNNYDYENINWLEFDKSLILSFISCLIRPTNGMIWLILGIHLLFKFKKFSERLKIIFHASLIGLITFIINIGIDFLYYGELTIPIYNFIKFNAISSLSKFYGVAPWHFHLFQSLPIILMFYLPFFIIGLIKYDQKLIKLIVLIVLIMFSIVDHKEFRFLYPIQPFLLLITGFGFYFINLHHHKLVKFSVISIIILNTIIAIFFTQINEKGVIDVINYLKYDPDVQSVGFLTPCHSTPWQSYIHQNDFKDLWFLTCEPPLHLLNSLNSSLEVENYMDESDYFYDNAELFLFKNFPPPFKKELRSPGIDYKYEWPTHLIFFGDLEPTIKEYLEDSPYRECERFFNSYFHWDDRRRGDVIVYCKWPWE